MLIFMMRYVFLSWFLFGGSISEHLLMREVDIIDKDFYRLAACTARCIKYEPQQEQNQTMQHNQTEHFQNCYEQCKIGSTTTPAKSTTKVRQIYENYIMKLVCRDDRSVTFRIELEDRSTKTTTARIKTAKLNVSPENQNLTMQIESHSLDEATITNRHHVDTVQTPEISVTAPQTPVFIFKVHGSKDVVWYLSNDSVVTIGNLQHNTTYNITTWAVHATFEYSVIAKAQPFATLRRGYTPGMVRDIHVKRFITDEANDMRLQALITWKPSADMTCHYNLISFAQTDQGFDMPPMEMRNPRQLYTYTLENLTFASDYMVGIRAKNSNNISKESELAWASIQTPSCAEWYNYNFTICPPLKPDGLDVKRLLVSENTNSLNISWNKPEHPPSYYTVRVLDIMEGGNAYAFNVSKELNTLFVPELELVGVLYEVHLTAYTPGGNATASFTQINTQMVLLPDKSHQIVKLIAAILAPIFCAIILSLTIFIICHRRAKLKRYQERCKYFEELEKKAPIDPKANFDFPTKTFPLLTSPEDLTQFQLDLEEKIFFNDDMEIDRMDVVLHEVLGEGAFGLVRRGVYNDAKLGAREVAVKMLKDQPSIDDVRAFRREIEVMKSVEKHPNIVGIIGHCTRHYNEMMLLTEYCSFGNLLDFLRDEWKYLYELNVKCNQVQQSKQQQQEQCITTATENARNIALYKHNSNHNFYKISTNNNNPNSAGLFNFETNLIERLKFKYKNLQTTPLQQSKKCELDVISAEAAKMLSNNDASDAIVASPPPPPARSQANLSPAHTTNAADNKSYGYADICHTPCKCQRLDIVVIKDMDEPSDSDANSNPDKENIPVISTSDVLPRPQRRRIEVKSCECRHALLSSNNSNAQQFSNEQSTACNRNGSHAISNKSYRKFLPQILNEAALRQRQRRSVSVATRNAANTQGKGVSNNDNVSSDFDMSPDTGGADNNLSDCVKRSPLRATDLMDIAKQVAVGMEFLAKNKVVHRDLAARNVLVAPDRTVKIADFGLSRDVYQENVYKKTGNGKLPIKWLALESMTHQVYTTQSDVWSFGILLYEIVTLGGTPYPSIPTSRLLHLLKTGYRMEKPKNCGQEFYNMMRACWNVNPAERPNFGEIIKMLDNFLCDVPEKQIVSVLSTTQMSEKMTTMTGPKNLVSTEIHHDPCLQSQASQSPLDESESIEETLNNDDSYLKPL